MAQLVLLAWTALLVFYAISLAQLVDLVVIFLGLAALLRC